MGFVIVFSFAADFLRRNAINPMTRMQRTMNAIVALKADSWSKIQYEFTYYAKFCSMNSGLQFGSDMLLYLIAII